MLRLVLAAAAAFTLAGAAPAYACGADCPMHKTAAAEAGKKDAKVGCACTAGKECTCAPGKCDCHAKKEQKDEKKS